MRWLPRGVPPSANCYGENTSGADVQAKWARTGGGCLPGTLLGELSRSIQVKSDKWAKQQMRHGITPGQVKQNVV